MLIFRPLLFGGSHLDPKQQSKEPSRAPTPIFDMNSGANTPKTSNTKKLMEFDEFLENRDLTPKHVEAIQTTYNQFGYNVRTKLPQPKTPTKPEQGKS